jgi:hypothetical protein
MSHGQRESAVLLFQLRYFFCADSLAASAAREKSKIDPAATSPLISFQRI